MLCEKQQHVDDDLLDNTGRDHSQHFLLLILAPQSDIPSMKKALIFPTNLVGNRRRGGDGRYDGVCCYPSGVNDNV